MGRQALRKRCFMAVAPSWDTPVDLPVHYPWHRLIKDFSSKEATSHPGHLMEVSESSQ